MSIEVDLKWVPVKTVQRILGISRERVRQLCLSGALYGVMIDGRRLVAISSVNRLIEDRAKGVRRLGRCR